MMESVDVPGVIGRVGTVLGTRGINIAEWRLGRVAVGAEALSFINLDALAPPEVLDELLQLDGVTCVRHVML